MASVTSVVVSTNGMFSHIKSLGNYFHLKILGNDNLSIYEFGDNIDEDRVELTSFVDIKEHFDTLIEEIR